MSCVVTESCFSVVLAIVSDFGVHFNWYCSSDCCETRALGWVKKNWFAWPLKNEIPSYHHRRRHPNHDCSYCKDGRSAVEIYCCNKFGQYSTSAPSAIFIGLSSSFIYIEGIYFDKMDLVFIFQYLQWNLKKCNILQFDVGWKNAVWDGCCSISYNWDWMDWISLDGVKYRAAYAANKEI